MKERTKPFVLNFTVGILFGLACKRKEGSFKIRKELMLKKKACPAVSNTDFPMAESEHPEFVCKSDGSTEICFHPVYQLLYRGSANLVILWGLFTPSSPVQAKVILPKGKSAILTM